MQQDLTPEQFEQILNASISGVRVIDLDYNTIYFNQAFLELAKMPSSDIKAVKCYEAQQSESCRTDKCSVNRIRNGEFFIAFEEDFIRLDGTKIPCIYSAAPFYDQAGEVIGIIESFEDISERNQYLVRLKESEARFRRLFEHSNDAIFIYNLRGKIYHVNQQAVEMLGYSESRLKEMTIMSLFPESELSKVERQFKTILAAGGIEFESVFEKSDTTRIWVDISARLVEPNNRLVQAVVRDITERKQAEEALIEKSRLLERSNTDLQRFAYIAGHDLQEPLRTISSYVQLLKKRYKGKLDQDADDFINFTVDGATRLHRLINDLLDFSRLTTQGKEFTPVKCDDAAQAAVRNLSKAIEESDAKITIGPLPEVMGDDGQLVSLFQNLIGNAIKFRGEESPTVEVAAVESSGSWRFSVADNGIGIDPQYSKRIFAMFQRLHNREEYSGTGIGLALCRRIVDRHGGHLWVESNPGEGATFFFEFPNCLEAAP